ncbi:DUF5675 family protein [Bacteroides sp. 519]|uniref:DUF5675 family protein n=1 Tax=Bacteroides sp. 519 TaxID=2302937 RepID=UPI001EF36B47|nr:DUF5675 family protein [Bacteroides sp. 519]
MEIMLKRTAKKREYTIGKLYLNDKYFCDTLEDTVRDLSKEEKVPGKTAIPAGIYKVIVNKSPRFGRQLPKLLDVPHFTGILIHKGNTSNNTSGCILVGESIKNGMAFNSAYYEQELVELLCKETDITIEIK